MVWYIDAILLFVFYMCDSGLFWSYIPSLLFSFVLNSCFLVYHFNSFVGFFKLYFWAIFIVVALWIIIYILIYHNLLQINSNIILVKYRNFIPLYLHVVPLLSCYFVIYITYLYVVSLTTKFHNYCFVQVSFKSIKISRIDLEAQRYLYEPMECKGKHENHLGSNSIIFH